VRTLALLAVTYAASAQPIVLRTDPSRIGIIPSVRTDPPFSSLMRRFVPSLRAVTIANGPAFFSRMFVDEARHIYIGYELLLERKENDTYLGTIGKLGVTPMELAASPSRRILVDLSWTLLPLPAMPEPRLFHEGDTLSIELFVDPATGDRLIDDIRINPAVPATRLFPVPSAEQPLPTISGNPREFAASDADLQFVLPRALLLNGVRQGSIAARNVRGPLVWLYLPDHGRYVFSLTPRAGLNFVKAGRVGGGVLLFAVGKDSVILECGSPMAPGSSLYHLYVLHDANWEPTSEAQKVRPLLGSVSPDELIALTKK
jgi:hypothetical protein